MRLYLIHERHARIKLMVAREQASVHALVESGQVVLEQSADQNAVAFHLQGNLELNTADNLKTRMKHRMAPRIVQALGIWKETALRSGCLDLDSEFISREGHALCLRPVYRALMEEYEPEEAEEAISDDWEADTRGAGQLSCAAFGDAIFELSDVWTETLEEQEYVDFLWRLLEHVTRSLSGGDELVYKHAQEVHWCEDLTNGGAKTDAKLLPEDPTPRQKSGKRVQERRKGAKIIQAGMRGRRDRKSASERKQAVKTIQAGGRGHHARKVVQHRRQSIVTIQKNARRRGAYREASAMRKAVLTVQMAFRLVKGLKRHRDDKQKHGSMAVLDEQLERFRWRAQKQREADMAMRDEQLSELDKFRRRAHALRNRRRALGALGALGAAAPENADDLVIQLASLKAAEYDATVIREPDDYPSPLTVGRRRHASDTYIERKHPKVKARARYLDFLSKEPKQKSARELRLERESVERNARAVSLSPPPRYGMTRSVSLSPLDPAAFRRRGSQQSIPPYVPKWGPNGQQTRVYAPVPIRAVPLHDGGVRRRVDVVLDVSDSVCAPLRVPSPTKEPVPEPRRLQAKATRHMVKQMDGALRELGKVEQRLAMAYRVQNPSSHHGHGINDGRARGMPRSVSFPPIRAPAHRDSPSSSLAGGWVADEELGRPKLA